MKRNLSIWLSLLCAGWLVSHFEVRTAARVGHADPPTVTVKPGLFILVEGQTLQGAAVVTSAVPGPHLVTINWGDGSPNTITTLPITGSTATFSFTHVFRDDPLGFFPDYNVAVTVADPSGGIGSTAFAVTVSNVAPAVNAGPNLTVPLGDLVFLTGTFTDPGTPDTHTLDIDWDGDGAFEQTIPLPLGVRAFSTSQTFTTAGPKVVTVRVTDDDGGIGTDTVTVTVQPPLALTLKGGNLTLFEGETLQGGGVVTSPFPGPHFVTINWGDGSPNTILTLSLTGGPATFPFTHVYVDDPSDFIINDYKVAGTVTDPFGGIASTAFAVTVNNAAPSGVNAGPDRTAPLGTPVPFTGTFTDPGTPDAHTVDIDWDGDGVFDQAINLDPGARAFSASQTFTTAGQTTVTFRVTDEDGGTGTDTVTVTVQPPLALTLKGGNLTLFEGETLQGGGVVTSPFPGLHIVRINWGDGTPTTTITLPLTGGPATFPFTHVYVDDPSDFIINDYKVAGTVTDPFGGIASTAFAVTVNNAAPSGVNAGPDRTAPLGTPVPFTGTFTDPGTLDAHTVDIDWDGDGVFDQAINLDPGARAFSTSQTFTTAGPKIVTVRVTDKDGGTGTDTVNVTVTAAESGRLTATKTDALLDDADEDGLPGPGDVLRYTVVVQNTGGSPVHGVQFHDGDGPGFNGTFLVPDSETTTQGTIVPQEGVSRVVVQIGTIEPGGVVRIEFDAVIQPGFVEAVSNQALVDSDSALIVTDDPDTPVPDDATVTRMEPPRLKAFKTGILTVDADADGVLSPGDTLTYEILIQHVGGMAAHNVDFSDRDERAFNGSGLVIGTVTTEQGIVRVGNSGEFTKATGVEVGIGTMYSGEKVIIRFDTVIDPGFPFASNQGLVTSDELQVQVVTDDPNTAVLNDATLTVSDPPTDVRFTDALGRARAIAPYQASVGDAVRIALRQAEYLAAQLLCLRGIRAACLAAEQAVRAIDRLVPQDVRYRAAVSNPGAASVPATLINIGANGNVLTTFSLTMRSDSAGRAVSESIIAVAPGVPILPGIYGSHVFVRTVAGGSLGVQASGFGAGLAKVCPSVPLEAVPPLGGLIFDQPVPGELTSSNNTKCLAIKLDEGQTITVRIEPTSPGLRPSVKVLGPDGSPLGAAIAPAAGRSVLLQTLPALARGTYTVEIGSVQSTVGRYNARVVLNAALETEPDPAPNDTVAAAQNVQSSFVYLVGTSSRGAVLGTSDAGTPDFYSFKLAAGDTFTVALKAQSTGDLNLSLFDKDGTSLASSAPALNVDEHISNFTAPSTGTYYVGVSGAPGIPYSLVLTRNAALDVELSNDGETVVPLGPSGVAIGWVGGSDSQDIYAFTAIGDQVIEIVTSTPGEGPGQFENTLNPGLHLLDPTGQVVAVGTPLPDGRNERLAPFTVLTPGLYRVVVSWQPSADRATNGAYRVTDSATPRR